MIRQAQTKDLLAVAGIFKELISQAQKLGTELFSEDPGTLLTGVLESIILMMNDLNGIILIDENERGEITGMIAGAIRSYPRFYRHTLVGEIVAAHPVSFASARLYEAFDTWREGKGATITTGYVFPGNAVVLKAFERHGMKICQHWITGSFKEKKCTMMNLETAGSSVA